MPDPRLGLRPRADRLDRAVTYAADQSALGLVRTAVPGVVDEYDPDTKRAIVQPIIKQAYFGRRAETLAPVVDVPVIQPSTGGFMLHLPISVGDPMVLLFTQTGLATFKLAWDRGERMEPVEPVLGTAFSDAVAMPWGAHNIEPADPSGICLQSADGNAALIVKQDEILLRVGQGRARLRSTNFDTWRE